MNQLAAWLCLVAAVALGCGVGHYREPLWRGLCGCGAAVLAGAVAAYILDRRVPDSETDYS